MSRSSVSPFFSQKFQPISIPMSATHSSPAVPTHKDPDESPSPDPMGFHAYVHGSTSVQVSESHSAANQSFEFPGPPKPPRLHAHGTHSQISSSSQLSSPHSDNDSSKQHSSSSINSDQSHLPVSSSSEADRMRTLSVIEEDSYEDQGKSNPDHTMPSLESNGQSEHARKKSAGYESYAKAMRKLEETRRMIEKDLDSMYPWRLKKPTATGMSSIQRTAFNANKTIEMEGVESDLGSPKNPLKSVGLSELEYSMEPRNFSRGPTTPLLVPAPVVRAVDSAKNADVPTDKDSSKNNHSTNEKDPVASSSATNAEGEKRTESFYDELLPLSRKFQAQSFTDRKDSRSMLKGNELIYDQLLPLSKKSQELRRVGGTGDAASPSQASSNSSFYDELLPLSTRYQPYLPASPSSSGKKGSQGSHGSALGSLTPPPPTRATATTTSSVHPSTYSHPHREKLLKPTSATKTPAPAVGQRSREQRYSLATVPTAAEIVKQRKETSPPVRRKSHPSNLKLDHRSRPVSYAGTEESIGWNFVSGGSRDTVDMPFVQHGHKQDKTWWTRKLFGGDKTVHDIFNPKKAHKIKKYLQIPGIDVNAANSEGDTPLHCYVKSDRADKIDLLTTLLVHCNCKVLQIDKPNAEGKSPLHIAVEINDIWAAKVLIAFGADVNCPNRFHDTPLDLVSRDFEPGDYEKIHEMLTLLDAMPGGGLSPTSSSLHPLHECLNSITNESYDIDESQQLGAYLEEKRHAAFVFKLEELLSKQNLEFSVNTGISLPPGIVDYHGTFFDAMIARQNQLLRINEWKSTVEFKKGSGSRMLYLDGGGIRGLIEIEILEQIESLTGRRITELFDWIIGTSTGGILALCLVYLGMTLGELRQLYFRLREEVFIGGMLSTSRKSDALENLLKQQFGDKCMNEIEFPKVLIPAVSTKTNPPQLNFFNNCFKDQFSTQLVWKVARYTSAAPMYFTECDNYMDGGVLANNPSLSAWTVIQGYHDRPKVAMAVSLGTGVYPSQEMGETDILGKGLFNLRGTMKRAQRFIRMISTALVESETVASTFHTTCEALDIKFFRFSPTLHSVIDPDETDNKVLVDMLIQTKQYLSSQDSKRNLDEMVRLFRHIVEVSRGLNLDKT